MKPLRVVAGSIVAIVLLVSSGHAERVGLTGTWVEVSRPLSYRIEGGLKEFQATGEVCNLKQSFVVEGDGVTIRFTPKSNRTGRYEYSGKVGGVEASGQGTYVVEYHDLVAIKIVATDFFYALKRAPGACQD